jgi:hypothetical protein
VKHRSVTSVALLAILTVIVSLGMEGTALAGASEDEPQQKPNPLTPMTRWVRFVLSQRAKVANGQTALEKTIPQSSSAPYTLQTVDEETGSAPVAPEPTSRCDAPGGSVFNLEPRHGSPHIPFHVPINSESVDFIPNGGVLGSDLVVETAVDYRGIFDYFFAPNVDVPHSWGRSFSGYYVHRSGADCSASFEGGLPHVYYGPTQELLYGGGLPVVAADPTRGQFYAADLRFGSTVDGVALLSTTAARLNDPNRCPSGTHYTDADGKDLVSSRCWPHRILLGATRQIGFATFPDKPYVRADERSGGKGAGDVYVTWTVFDIFQGISWIDLAVCPHTFATKKDCSAPVKISGADPNPTLAEVSVRPDGVITVTYLNFNFPIVNGHQVEVLDIRYVSCRPAGAPNPPTCSSPVQVFTEKQPLPTGLLLIPSTLQQLWTYPVHGSRWDGNEYEEFVAWARCSVDPFFTVGSIEFGVCPRAEVMMTWAATDASGQSHAWATPVRVDTRRGNQILPWMSSDDKAKTINLGYLSAEQDRYDHRYQLFRAQIKPGEHAATTPKVVSELPDEPAADPFDWLFLGGTFGGYIGVTSRSSGDMGRTYFGFTGQIHRGFFRGRMLSNSNNLLSAADY